MTLAASARRALTAIPTWVRALAFYLAMALLTIARHALGHPTTVCACDGTQDPASYMWALAWWPHALAHGLNPFVTNYLWSPTGVNVAQGAMIPTAALVLAPVTALVGPIAAYNVLSIASPVLAALTAYLLCRRIVRRELPAVAGGYLFGFSAYEFAQLIGHLNLTLVFLIPVMVHIPLRRLDRELSRGAYLAWMALLFVAQAGLSTELLAESVALGAVVLVCARFLAPPPRRPRIDGLIAETVGAGLIAAAVASPFLYYALLSGGFPKGAPGLSDAYGLDLLNPLLPTSSTWLGHRLLQSLGLSYEGRDISEADGYLSVALVLAFALWLVRERRSTLARLLAIVTGVSFVAALGSHLHVDGQQTVALPFDLVRRLPMFDNIVPSRIVLFAMLAISIGVAAWLATPAGRSGVGARARGVRWLVVLIGAVAILPNPSSALYGGAPQNPRFFSTTMYRRELARGETVLVLPFGERDLSMLWQAETGFYFDMPEGYISGTVPAPFNTQPPVRRLVKDLPPHTSALEAFIREHRVSHVVVDLARAGPWPGVMARLGLSGQRLGGVLLYSVPDRSPSIAARALRVDPAESASRISPRGSATSAEAPPRAQC
jgi:hypothetical protein